MNNHRITKFRYLLVNGMKWLLRHYPGENNKNPLWLLRRIKRAIILKGSQDRICFHAYSADELEEQRHTSFGRRVTFSILVPLYNTPEQFLKKMIQSVEEQTYADWELCLADASDTEHEAVRLCCEQKAANDKRIRYRRLPNNLGISDSTNAALEIANGNYIALLDHDDELHPAALFEAAKAIALQGADFIYTDEATFLSPDLHSIRAVHCKPDFAPDTLRGNNYICHFTAFSTELLSKTGIFRSEFNGSQNHDMILRLTEQARHIVHIPKVLYYRRANPGSMAENIDSKPYAIEAGCRAVRDHLSRIGLTGEVSALDAPGVYRIRYALNGLPKISILIPSRDHAEDLSHCISSIIEKTTYPNWEIIIIDNDSVQPETFSYYEKLKDDERIRVISWNGEFNYPAINNYGAGFASGDYLILLNNDTEIITPEWIQEMLMFAQRSDVGIVGAKLYYPNNSVQHAGVILGLGGTAGHIYACTPRNEQGYFSRLVYAQELSAVTGACMMVSASLYRELGGLDADFRVALNDIDFCMQVRQAGYRVIWTPFAELYHAESRSRGNDLDTPVKYQRYMEECALFHRKWKAELDSGDPFYNPNFTLKHGNYLLKEPQWKTHSYRR